MIKTFCYFLLFVYLLCLSCERGDVYDSNAVVVKPDSVCIDPTQVFQSYNAIPLETGNDFLISKIRKMLIYDSCFFILSTNGDVVYQFGFDGKHKRNISNYGRGELEHLYIEDISIANDTLYILTRLQNKIVEYNLNSNCFCGEINIGDYYSYLSVINSNNIFLWSDNSSSLFKNLIVYSATEGIKKTFCDFNEKNHFWGSNYFTPFHRQANGELFLTQLYDHSIYRCGYDSDSLEIYMNVVFEADEQLPDNILNASFEDMSKKLQFAPVVHYISDFFGISDNKYLICYLYKFQYRMSFIDNGTARNYLLNGSEEFPYATTSNILGIHNDELITYQTASAILSYYNIEHNVSENNFLFGISEDANPVVFLHKFRQI